MFGVMLTGKQMLSVDFQDITLTEGQAIIVSPGQIHRPINDASVDGFVLAFTPETLIATEISLIEEYSISPKPISISMEDFQDISSLYEILLHRINRESDVELSIAAAIKGLVLRNVLGIKNDAPGRYLRLTIELKKLLRDNISKVKRPSEYASMLNVSGVYLNEAVKSVTGMNVGNYIISYVLLMAKRELTYTDTTAQEIAFNLGYDDYLYFSRLFKRHTGLSVREFRSKNLE